MGRIFILIFIGLISMPNICIANDNESYDRFPLEATYTILHLIDWQQTLTIAREPDKYYEVNGIVGKHPSASRVNQYGAVSLLLHWTLSYTLSDKWAKSFQLSTLVIKTGCVLNNESIGIGISGRF